MKTILRIAKYGVLAAVVIVVVLVGLLWSVRAYHQHSNTKAFAITSAGGIDESGYVSAGGIQQWVQIRGEDRNNPVVLCVHGGPGATWIPVTRLFRSWEKTFTVVFWDQRGAGKTLKASGPGIASTMSIERMAQDGIEVAEYVRMKLGQNKLILLGHSFGSVLGVQMVKRRPDLFHAFVGTGQASDLPRSTAMEYEQLQRQAQQANDQQTLAALAQIGPPPFGSLQEVAVYFEQVGKYQPASDTAAIEALKRSLLSPVPGYSLRDEVNRFRGFSVVPPWALYEELLTTRLAGLGPDFEVPVVMIQGADDPVTPLTLAEEYFQGIRAPHKEFVVLQGGGHFAVWSMADRFLAELTQRVRPLVR